jgi:NitT/TauT family transport system substrate-binding protein
MNTARFWKFISFFLAATLLVACTGPAATKPHSLKVAYTRRWGDYTMVIAKEKGFFTKYSVDVEPIYYEVSSKALPELASSQIDGGMLTLGDTISVSTYTELTAVAISDDGGVSVIVAKPEIRSIADLKGKKIGVVLGSTYEILVREMLRAAFLQPKDVILVNLDPENVPQGLRDGKIDAGFIWQPYTVEATTAGNHILFSSTQASWFFTSALVFRSDVIFANAIAFRSDVVKQRPDDIRNYLKAWFDAAQFRALNPQESNEIIAKTLNIPLDQVTGDAQLFTLDENRNLYLDQPAGNAESIYQWAQLNADFLIRNGGLTRMPDLHQLFNPLYLRDDGKK